jgi:hypothetical protein
MLSCEAEKGQSMNQIINMIIRQVMRQLINRGVSAGFDQASKIGKGKGAGMDEETKPQMTGAERRAQRQARQSMKAMRRISKF